MLFKLIGFVIRYGGVIVAAITMVEGLVSKDTPGDQKKVLVIKAVKEFLTKVGVQVTPAVETMISSVIDMAVTLFNLFGIFRHKDEMEEDVAPVEAAKVERVVKAVVESPDEVRLRELEAILKAQMEEGR